MTCDQQQTVSVQIFGKYYSIQLPVHEEQAFKEAIQLLESQMSMVKADHPLSAPDDITMVTALNIAHQLIQLRRQHEECTPPMLESIKSLQRRIACFIDSDHPVLLPE